MKKEKFLKVMFGNRSNANGSGLEYKIGKVNIAEYWNPQELDAKKMGDLIFLQKAKF